jgi:beta-mannosidase
MIRVWGGGVFEPDFFYEMCDEKGLLVWQDCKPRFDSVNCQPIHGRLTSIVMFACAVYPVFPKFLASVEAEARENVVRLRHHPSLVLLCGNNEDCKSSPFLCRRSRSALMEIDQQIMQWDMKQEGDPLPARVIYEKILPDVINELVEPAIPYWPGSPYGGKGWDTADPTVGDVVRRFLLRLFAAACGCSLQSINGTFGLAKSQITSTGTDSAVGLSPSLGSPAYPIGGRSITG